MSKTSSEVKNRYNKKTYDQILLAVPKGTKEEWKEKAEKEGLSLTKYIQRATEEYK